MASDSSSCFRPGALPISLRTQNTTERVEEKNKWTNTDLGQLQAHFQAIAGGYLRESSTEPLGMLSHLLTVRLRLLIAPFCRPCPSLDSYLKLTVVFCPPLSTASLCLLWNLPSLLHFRSRAHAFCVGFVPKQTKRSSEWYQHKRKRMLPIVSQTFPCIGDALVV